MKRMSLWLAALCLMLGAGAANAAPSPAQRLFAVPMDLSNQIVELDPVTGSELHRIPAPESTQTLPLPFPSPILPIETIGLAFDGTHLWFVNGALGDTLYRIDPDTGAFSPSADVFPIPHRGVFSNFDGLAALNGRIYIAEWVTDDVLEFNPALPANHPDNFRVVFDGQDARQPKQVDLLGGLAAVDGRLVATVAWNEIVEIDPVSGLAVYTVNPVGEDFLGAAVLGNEIYLAHGDAPGIGVFPRLGPPAGPNPIPPHVPSLRTLVPLSLVTGQPYAISALDGGPVAAEPPDSDGDGVPDELDECPQSDLRARVTTSFEPGKETSIVNKVNARGCSIQDYVNACAVMSRNHGQYVNCIRDLAGMLLNEGAITLAQAREMHLGAAHANVGKGPKPKGK